MKIRLEDILALNSIEGFGYKNLKGLLDVFGDTARIFKASKADIVHSAGINPSLAEGIKVLDPKIGAFEAEQAAKKGIRLTTVFDDDYPENLKTIYSPPIVLYSKGHMDCKDSDAVAVVGTRRPSRYGISICTYLSRGLAGAGITVVSGLARGIDTVAHRSALERGRTIAVLGSGLDNIYPSENRELAERISGRGVVLSEFLLGCRPFKRNFPRRNRIIAGLSLGVVVVEAREKSGSLITANFCLEENRELFAVPGEACAERSKGTNNLIRQGAKLVESLDDIIEEVGRRLKYASCDNIRTQDGTAGSEHIELSEEEARLKAVLGTRPVYIDRIVRDTGLGMEKVCGILLNLELKNVIRQLPGKNYIIKQ